jgi:putative transposase
MSDLNKHITSLKHGESSWLKEVNSKVQQQSIINLLNAYNNYFKNKSHFKEPVFKSKYGKQACRFPIDAIMDSCFLNNKLDLVKSLRNIKYKTSDKYHELLKDFRQNIKSITVSKSKSGKYHASVLIEISNEIIKPCGNGEVGIDLGVKTFIITSDGEEINQPKWIRDNQKKLSRLQRSHSKKKKGSKNKEKARLKLARFHEKLTNQKEFFMHDIVNKLIDDNQIICLETLNVVGMMKNHKLARAIQEKNIGQFNGLMIDKASKRGAEVIKVDRWFASSKLCSVCGHKHETLMLKDRVWTCEKCKSVHDRDFNASLNILNEGLIIKELKTVSKDAFLKEKVGMSKPEPECESILKDCGDAGLLVSVMQ